MALILAFVVGFTSWIAGAIVLAIILGAIIKRRNRQNSHNVRR